MLCWISSISNFMPKRDVSCEKSPFQPDSTKKKRPSSPNLTPMFSADGHVGRNVTSTVWYQLSVWRGSKRSLVFPREENLILTGHAFVPLLAWIKRRMKALVDTSALLWLCVVGCATCAQAAMKVSTGWSS